MNRFARIALAALCTLGMAAPALAEGGRHGKMGFDRWDTNKDGAVTLAEMKAAMKDHPRRLAHADEMFKKLDANNDGKATKAEFDAWKAQHKGRRGHKDGNK